MGVPPNHQFFFWGGCSIFFKQLFWGSPIYGNPHIILYPIDGGFQAPLALVLILLGTLLHLVDALLQMLPFLLLVLRKTPRNGDVMGISWGYKGNIMGICNQLYFLDISHNWYKTNRLVGI